jgi:hypothetical protein
MIAIDLGSYKKQPIIELMAVRQRHAGFVTDSEEKIMPFD